MAKSSVARKHPWWTRLRHSRRLALVREFFYLDLLASRAGLLAMLAAMLHPLPIGWEGSCAVLGWAAAYLLAVRWLAGRDGASQPIEGVPRWSFEASLAHHIGGLGLLAAGWLGTGGRVDADWLGGELGLLERHVFYSIIGCMLKDGLLFSLSWDQYAVAMACHHVGTVLGCALCLAMPVGAGWTVLVAWLAEMGSACYVWYKLWPSRLSTLVYFIGMTGSNLFGLVGGYKLGQMNGMPENYVWGYWLLVFFIVALRTAGQGMEAQQLAAGKVNLGGLTQEAKLVGHERLD